MLGPHFHQAVVDEHLRTGFQVLGQIFIGDGHHLIVTVHFPGGQGEGGAGLQFNGTILEGLYSDLRAFGIQNGGHRQTQLFRRRVTASSFFAASS